MDRILTKITSPLIDQTDISIKLNNSQLPIKKEFQNCLNTMKTNNIDTYKIILLHISEEKKSKMAYLINEVAEVEGKTRLIRKIVGVKDNGKTRE